MKPNAARATIVVLALLTIALGLAACGSKSDNTKGEPEKLTLDLVRIEEVAHRHGMPDQGEATDIQTELIQQRAAVGDLDRAPLAGAAFAPADVVRAVGLVDERRSGVGGIGDLGGHAGRADDTMTPP